MAVETASFINQLAPSYPQGTDAKYEGDNHIRLVKQVVINSWPNVGGAVTPTHTQLNTIPRALLVPEAAGFTLPAVASRVSAIFAFDASGLPDTTRTLVAFDASTAAAIAGGNTATTQAGIATTGGNTATTQAGIATTQAGIATTQAGIATTGAGTATTQAGIATTGAGTATTQAGIATTGAGTATTQAGIATTQAGTATTQAGTATTQAGIATTGGNTATTQAGIATTGGNTATTQAGIATTQAGTATTQAGIATTQAGIATTQAGLASQTFTGTSVTSLTIALGAQSLTTQLNKAWVVGQYINIARTSNPTGVRMSGIITAYTAGTGVLALTVDSITSSGTVATDWTISIAGQASSVLPVQTATQGRVLRSNQGNAEWGDDFGPFVEVAFSAPSVNQITSSSSYLNAGWGRGANTISTALVATGGPNGLGFVNVTNNSTIGNAFVVPGNYFPVQGQSRCFSAWFRGITKPSVGNLLVMQTRDVSNVLYNIVLPFTDPSIITDGVWRRYSINVTHAGADVTALATLLVTDTGALVTSVADPQLNVGTTPLPYVATGSSHQLEPRWSYNLNSVNGAFNCWMPTAPVANDWLQFKDSGRAVDVNNIQFVVGPNKFENFPAGENLIFDSVGVNFKPTYNLYTGWGLL